MDPKSYLANVLSDCTKQSWTSHTSLERAELHLSQLKLLSLSRVKSPSKANPSSEAKVQSSQADQLTESGSGLKRGGVSLSDTVRVVGNAPIDSQVCEDCPSERNSCSFRTLLARYIVSDLHSQQLLEQAAQAEAAFMEATYGVQMYSPCPVDNDQPLVKVVSTHAPCIEAEVLHKPKGDGSSNNVADLFLALSLVRELDSQQTLVRATEAETKYVKTTTKSMNFDPSVDPNETVSPLRIAQPSPEWTTGLERETNVLARQVCISESLSSELQSQQSMVECLEAESRYVGVMSSNHISVRSGINELDLDMEPVHLVGGMDEMEPRHQIDGMEPGHHIDGMEPRHHIEVIPTFDERKSVSRVSEMELSTVSSSAPSSLESSLIPIAADNQDSAVLPLSASMSEPSGSVYLPAIMSEPSGSVYLPASMSEHSGSVYRPATMSEPSGSVYLPASMSDASTSTDQSFILTHSIGTTTDPVPVTEVACNTSLSCFDILRRAKETEEFEMLKAEHHVMVRQLNEHRSQRMVADQLVKIVQSDLSDLQQKHVSDMTARMRLENELGDAKVELAFSNCQLQEKEERIKELEDSLTGTSILVRKLEEQNAVSLMNRGGIDYMLQAKLAEGRAKEAEQKLEVLQTELLQSQGEVRHLLERVSETSRERSEMISSKVHTQLLRIADDRAMAAESQLQLREREVGVLQEKLSLYEKSSSLPNTGSGSGLPYSQGVYGVGTGSFGLRLGSPFSSNSSFGLSLSSTLPPYGTSLPQYRPLSTSTAFSQPSSAVLTSGYCSTLSGLESTSEEIAVAGRLSSSFLPSSIKTPKPRSHEHVGKSHNTPSKVLLSHDTPSMSHDTPSKVLLSHESSSMAHDISSLSHDTPSKEDEYILPLPSEDKLEKEQVLMSDREDSSDWSSSEDEDGGKKTLDEGVPLVPSSHVTLISQWEWRAMNKDADTGSHAAPQSFLLKKKPPPLAPKPKHLFTVSRREVSFEAPSSFYEGIHKPLLGSGEFMKPKGPHGRRLPVRFSKQVLVFN